MRQGDSAKETGPGFDAIIKVLAHKLGIKRAYQWWWVNILGFPQGLSEECNQGDSPGH
jgi:hypothetical protein